jgi:cytochrome c biogenesis protein ResB
VSGVPVIGRIARFLRSRRLVVWLLVGVTGWSVVGTLVPQASRDAAGVARWTASYPAAVPFLQALGLFDAFGSPTFLVAMALLFACTVACAWERTSVSWREFRGRRGLTEAQIARLAERAPIRVAAGGVPEGTAVGPADPVAVIARVRSALATLRLRTRAGARAGEAVGGRFGLLGSPVFHWSLAALCLAIALGWLVRAEGMIGVPVGYTVDDTPEAYGRYAAGPLHPGTPSGVVFSASDFQLETVVGGVDHGASAVVTLGRGGTVVSRQRVYPNNPLRFGAVLIHQNEFGLASALRVEDASGAVAAAAEQLADFDPATASGTTTARLAATAADGTEFTIESTVIADRTSEGVQLRMPAEKRVAVSIVSGGTSTPTETLAPGQTMALPGGNVLRLVDVVYYARLSVVDDPSVYPIYAIFVIAAVGLSLAIFTPYRSVRFLLVEEGGRIIVHAEARHARKDPLFAERVEAALREGLGVADATAAPPAASRTTEGEG